MTIAWVQDCACQKPKELGYSYELWTYRLLIAHIRQHCVAVGHPALHRLSRSKLHKILRQGELRPHKIRYYVEKRDPDFEIKMANVLHVYKEVEIVNEYRRGEAGRQLGMVTISYDEKPGIQVLATTTPDRRRATTCRPCRVVKLVKLFPRGAEIMMDVPHARQQMGSPVGVRHRAGQSETPAPE